MVFQSAVPRDSRWVARMGSHSAVRMAALWVVKSALAKAALLAALLAEQLVAMLAVQTAE